MIAGERIGKFEVIREIARGGMASVDLARDTETGQEVAIKTLPAHFNHDPKFRKAFAREAYTASQLKQEAIVEVLDYGEVDRMPYLVMPYMSGGTLADLIKARERLSFNEAIRILRRIASALDYAHKQRIIYKTTDEQGNPIEERRTNIVHRDVKPANIYFDERGEAYLGDFGIVWLIEATHSSNTLFSGTAAYMSPEQVNPGQSRNGQGNTNRKLPAKRGPSIDGRSDIYSLGIVLYEMLCGKVPYEGETPTQQMMSHLTQPVPKIRDCQPDVHKTVEKILMKALAKQPEDRYPSAGAFVEALEKLSAPTSFTTSFTTWLTGIFGNTGDKYDFPIQPPRRWIPWAGCLGTALVLLLVVAGMAVTSGWIPIPFFPGSPPTAAAVSQPETSLPDPGIPQTGDITPTSTPTSTEVPTDTPQPTATSSYTPAPKQPVARDTGFDVTEDMAGQFSLAGFVSDPDGDLALDSLRVVSGPSHGRLDPQGGGNFTYTPEQNYDREDHFTYQVCDAGGLCAEASVSIQISPVNDPPNAQNDTYTGKEDQVLSVSGPGVLGNDSDVDGPELFVSGATNPSKGYVEISRDGSFTYTPNKDANGRDFFEYKVGDGTGDAKVATVTINLEDVPEPCITKNYAVTPNPITYVPPLIRGDPEFDGNGPVVNIDLQLIPQAGGTRWDLSLRMHAEETESDWTTAAGTKTINNFIEIPNGYELASIVTPSELDKRKRVVYEDKDHSPDKLRMRDDGPVSYFLAVGDTEGDEAGTETSVTVYFRRIEFLIRQVGNCK